MLRKTSMMLMLALGMLILSSCGLFDSTTELPDLMYMDRDEIRDRLEAEDLNAYFFVDDTVERTRPYMFIRYFDKSVGDEVERGSTISVVVSSGLEEDDEDDREDAPRVPLDPDGSFTAYEDVALYIDTFNTLPGNFDQSDHVDFDPDDFEAIPSGDRSYTAVAVDEDNEDAYIIFSDDGIIFYTDDDFESFTQLFGNEDYPPLDKDEHYTALSDVALYIRTFGKLPPNYFIRYEGDQNLYRNTYGYLPDFYEDHEYFGDLVGLREAYGQDAYFGYWHFSNHAGQLPSHTMFYIADINIGGAGWSRGNDRIVFSPGEKIVYYTPDHFNTYEILYGDGRD